MPIGDSNEQQKHTLGKQPAYPPLPLFWPSVRHPKLKQIVPKITNAVINGSRCPIAVRRMRKKTSGNKPTQARGSPPIPPPQAQ